ncbi:hypothetical protein [Nostoc sp.]|uniref:hypothetical protein n=1 Tax=Nostoc sp. TaxID=1180 RepID=UPI002FFAF370
MSNKHIATGAIPVQELVDSYSLLLTHYSLLLHSRCGEKSGVALLCLYNGSG